MMKKHLDSHTWLRVQVHSASTLKLAHGCVCRLLCAGVCTPCCAVLCALLQVSVAMLACVLVTGFLYTLSLVKR